MCQAKKEVERYIGFSFDSSVKIIPSEASWVTFNSILCWFIKLEVRSGQVRSECLRCTFRANCCSVRLSWAQVPAFAGFSVRDIIKLELKRVYLLDLKLSIKCRMAFGLVPPVLMTHK